jgi:predicted  nucleic acid-binding Zn-ribbon protein
LAAVPDTAAEQHTEIEALRARVAELERELAERTERANAAIAAAEDRVYWLDAWKIDLDALMKHRLAQRVFFAQQRLRRAAGAIRRRLMR